MGCTQYLGLMVGEYQIFHYTRHLIYYFEITNKILTVCLVYQNYSYYILSFIGFLKFILLSYDLTIHDSRPGCDLPYYPVCRSVGLLVGRFLVSSSPSSLSLLFYGSKNNLLIYFLNTVRVKSKKKILWVKKKNYWEC